MKFVLLTLLLLLLWFGLKAYLFLNKVKEQVSQQNGPSGNSDRRGTVSRGPGGNAEIDISDRVRVIDEKDSPGS